MRTYFTTVHATILHSVDDFLRGFLDAQLALAPARDHPALSRLYDSIPSYLHNGGRRMHAVSIVLAFEASGGTPRTAILPIAAGFQLYHYYTLVHDDIYDEDDHRRGSPTIHRRFADWFAERPSQDWSEEEAHHVFRNDSERRGAIAGWIQGNIVRALALEAIYSAPFASERLLTVAQRFNRHDIVVNAGQFLDVICEGKQIPSPAECLAIAELKTGGLFVAGVESGAELAGASQSQTDALCVWIKQLATAYQLQDDLADLSRLSEKGQGRAVGTDLMTCKPTYLLSLARTLGNSDQRAALDAWIAQPSRYPAEVDRIIGILGETGAIAQCEAEVRRRVQAGLRTLQEVMPPFEADSVKYMNQFAEYFVSAEYWERPL